MANWTAPWTEAKAIAVCRQAIEGGSAGRACMAVEGMNVSDSVEHCVEDIKVKILKYYLFFNIVTKPKHPCFLTLLFSVLVIFKRVTKEVNVFKYQPYQNDHIP